MSKTTGRSFSLITQQQMMRRGAQQLYKVHLSELFVAKESKRNISLLMPAFLNVFIILNRDLEPNRENKDFFFHVAPRAPWKVVIITE